MERENPAFPNSVLHHWAHITYAQVRHRFRLCLSLFTWPISLWGDSGNTRWAVLFLPLFSTLLQVPMNQLLPPKSSPSAPKQKSLWITTWAYPCLWATSLIFLVFIYIYSFSQAHAATHSWSCEVITTRGTETSSGPCDNCSHWPLEVTKWRLLPSRDHDIRELILEELLNSFHMISSWMIDSSKVIG